MRHVLFAIILSLPLAVGCTTPDMIKESGERNAREFAADMGLDIKGVSCSGRDSDHDSDTSCTLALASGENESIECNYDVAFTLLGQATGCKRVIFARGFAPAE